MFKFKKNKSVKTGVHTSKFRNPTPPPPLPKPPTSGSNAVKPRPTAFYISPGDLNDWVKTVAQIGDVAYCYIREVEEYGVYYYLEPDDNPFWRKIGPEFLKKYFKKENKEDKEVLGTMNCTYKTPCGWCTKWNKKCDKKIGCGNTNNKPQRGLRAQANMYDDAMNPCINCAENDKIFNLCAECGGAPDYKKFRKKENYYD